MSVLATAARRYARSVAILLVLTGWVVPAVFPHAADDDPACAPTRAGASGTGQLEAAAGGAQDDHCLACHSARSFRTTLMGEGWVALWLEPGLLVAASSDHRDSRPDIARLPARAPPSIPTV